MVNYQNAKIYKIVCNITEECYIGSTCQPTLAMRLTKHVGDYKKWKLGKSNKRPSFDIIDRNDYKIYLIESYPCNSKDELISREGEIIRQYKKESESVNYKGPGRTKEQWTEDNKERLRLQRKDYKLKNKEQIKIKKAEIFNCVCGSSLCKDNKAKHERTKKHQHYLKSIEQ